MMRNKKGVSHLKTLKDYYRLFFASAAILLTILAQLLIPKSAVSFTKTQPWYLYFLWLSLVLTLTAALLSIFRRKKGAFFHKSYFIGSSYLLLAVYNLVTEKLVLLPEIFFPSPNKILAVFVKNGSFILKCDLFSLRLLAISWAIGIALGLLTGILVGWFTSFNYWLDPIIKILGPIPSTAFVPIALTAFPTSFAASIFLISLSVWFPVTILTNSGIQNVKKTYFEVADTLGATTFQKIVHVALPASLPNVFVGIFNGACSSFITLMTAEMLGVKYGIGWYINWQREVLGYANVYAGLITIAITFSLIITLLFKVRDRLLSWQKGFIKW
ncbi:ABC transporter permease [Streptococcus ratti]